MESHQHMSASTVLRYFEYFLCYFCLHTTFLREVSFFFYSSLRFQSQNMRSFHKTWLPRYQLSYFRWPIAPRLIDTDGKLTFPSVYWPLKDLTFIHSCTDGRNVRSRPAHREKVRVQYLSQGYFQTSSQRSWGIEPPTFLITGWAALLSELLPPNPKLRHSFFKTPLRSSFGHISMLNRSARSTGHHM